MRPHSRAAVPARRCWGPGVSGPTRIERTEDPLTHENTWVITLTFADATAWNRERLEMLMDAIWLAGQAIAGNDERPLRRVA